MDSCTNCGAALRSGARFCTTCGTRVNDVTTDDFGWGAAARSIDADSQQTSVIEPVKPAEPTDQETSIAVRGRMRDWGSPQGDVHMNTDPASRFISALETDVNSTTENAKNDSLSEPTSTESTTDGNAADTWSFAAPATSNSETWKAPDSWASVVTTEAEHDEEISGEGIISEIVSSVEDDTGETVKPNEELVDTDSDLTHQGESVQRALDLLSELQTLVPTLPGTANSLSEAVIDAEDFGDLEEVLENIRDNPRDIQALGELAGKVDRISALLQSHTQMRQAINDTIKR